MTLIILKGLYFVAHIIMYPFITFLGREIPTYGVCMLLGIFVVFLLALKRAKKHSVLLEDLLIIGAFSLLFALPCASTAYAIVTFGLEGVLENIAKGNFQVFGGLVFYAALIGGIAGSILGIKIAKVKIVSAEKVIVPFIPIGHTIGRIGCVMAGCCYGIEYDGPFAIFYSNNIAGIPVSQGYFPVQLLEGFLNIFISLCLIKLANNCTEKFQLLSIYLIFYGIVRFFVEFLRGDDIRGVCFVLSTSQWVAIVTSAVGFLYLVMNVLKRRSHLFNKNNSV